jgi:hypothetical protein
MPGNRNPVAAAAATPQLTLDQAKALLNDPPASMSDRQKRRLTSWVAAYEGSIRRRQKERYDNAAKGLEERHGTIREDLETLTDMATQVKADLGNGRITAAEARDKLKGIFRVIKEVRERAAVMRNSEEQAWEMICASPEDDQSRQLQRFPTMGNGLPRLSSEFLEGDEAAKYQFE